MESTIKLTGEHWREVIKAELEKRLQALNKETDEVRGQLASLSQPVDLFLQIGPSPNGHALLEAKRPYVGPPPISDNEYNAKWSWRQKFEHVYKRLGRPLRTSEYAAEIVKLEPELVRLDFKEFTKKLSGELHGCIKRKTFTKIYGAGKNSEYAPVPKTNGLYGQAVVKDTEGRVEGDPINRAEKVGESHQPAS